MAGQYLPQRRALQKFGYHVRRVAVGADVEDGKDVRVIELARRTRLLFESTQAVRVAGTCRMEDLDGHVAIQPRIAGAVDLAHAAAAEKS